MNMYKNVFARVKKEKCVTVKMHENDNNKSGKRIESQYLCLFRIEIVLFIPQFFSCNITHRNQI